MPGTSRIVAKAWDEQCEKVLEVTLEENLQLIEESVAYLIENGKDVIVDAEHFYDGYNANPEYALKCLKTAANAGAKAIALCDTNGGMMPWDVEAITRIVVESLGDTMIGVHMHNDGGLAVANSIAGVRAGATMVQGCFNGYGERTGNADLVVIAANLALKMGKKVVPDGELAKLTECARTIMKNLQTRHFGLGNRTSDRMLSHTKVVIRRCVEEDAHELQPHTSRTRRKLCSIGGFRIKRQRERSRRGV